MLGVQDYQLKDTEERTMMEVISWPSVLFYCLFGIFVYYQQLHVRDFYGASQLAYLLLMLSALAGMITGLVYLIFYGWVVVWWAPIIIFLISLVFGTSMGVIIEALVGKHTLSLVGFLGWPLCAYFMFQSIPS